MKISAKEDMSSIRNERRVSVSEIEDIPAMAKEDWRSRLKRGIEAKGKSQRAVSLSAGMGPGYVNSLIKEMKDPTIDHLIKICEAAELSLYYVLLGVEMEPETEQIVLLLEKSSPRRRRGLLDALRDEDSGSAKEPDSSPSNPA